MIDISTDLYSRPHQIMQRKIRESISKISTRVDTIFSDNQMSEPASDPVKNIGFAEILVGNKRMTKSQRLKHERFNDHILSVVFSLIRSDNPEKNDILSHLKLFCASMGESTTCVDFWSHLQSFRLQFASNPESEAMRAAAEKLCRDFKGKLPGEMSRTLAEIAKALPKRTSRTPVSLKFQCHSKLPWGAEMNFKDQLPWEIKGVRIGEQAHKLGVRTGYRVLRVGDIELTEATKKQVEVMLAKGEANVIEFLGNPVSTWTVPELHRLFSSLEKESLKQMQILLKPFLISDYFMDLREKLLDYWEGEGITDKSKLDCNFLVTNLLGYSLLLMHLLSVLEETSNAKAERGMGAVILLFSEIDAFKVFVSSHIDTAEQRALASELFRKYFEIPFVRNLIGKATIDRIHQCVHEGAEFDLNLFEEVRDKIINWLNEVREKISDGPLGDEFLVLIKQRQAARELLRKQSSAKLRSPPTSGNRRKRSRVVTESEAGSHIQNLHKISISESHSVTTIHARAFKRICPEGQDDEMKRDEWVSGLKKLGLARMDITAEELVQAFEYIDSEKNGFVHSDEFETFMSNESLENPVLQKVQRAISRAISRTSINAPQSPYMSPYEVTELKSGWLVKQGRHLKSLKRRYCVLYSDKTFKYFVNESRAIVKGEAHFNKKMKILHQDCRFEVRTEGRNWRFQATTKQDATDWVKLLQTPAKVPMDRKLSYTNVHDKQLKLSLQKFRLPNDQKQLENYSCALQQSILHQGTLYLFDDYICFYSNIFGTKNTIVMKIADIKFIQKEKTAYIFNNAISFETYDNRNYMFRSFLTRDKCYTRIKSQIDLKCPKEEDSDSEEESADELLEALPAVTEEEAGDMKDFLVECSDCSDPGASVDFHAELGLSKDITLKNLWSYELPVTFCDAFQRFWADDAIYNLDEHHKSVGFTLLKTSNWVHQNGFITKDVEIECPIKDVPSFMLAKPEMRVCTTWRMKKLENEGQYMIHKKTESFDAPYTECFFVHHCWIITQSDKKLKIDGHFGMEWRKSTWLQSTIKSKSEQETKKADEEYFQKCRAKVTPKKKKKRKRRNTDPGEAEEELGVVESESSDGDSTDMLSSIIAKFTSGSISCPISLPTEMPEINVSSYASFLLILLLFILFWITLNTGRRNTDQLFRISRLEQKLDEVLLELRTTRADLDLLQRSCAQTRFVEPTADILNDVGDTVSEILSDAG